MYSKKRYGTSEIILQMLKVMQHAYIPIELVISLLPTFRHICK